MNLRNLRIERGMTQRELADKIGVSDVTIIHYEKKQRNPKPDTLKSLASVLDVTVDELLRDEDDERRVSANA